MSHTKKQTGVPPPETSEQVALRLRLELLDAEDKQRRLEEEIATLQGKSKMNSAVDVDDLRHKIAVAEAAFGAKTDELKKLSEKLVEAEQLAADETARADMSAMKAAALGDINLKLTAAVNVLKQQVVVSAPAAPPTRTDVQGFTPWYKKDMVWVNAGGAVLALFLVVCIAKLIFDLADDHAGATTSAVSAPATMTASKLEAKSAPVVPSIQPTTPSSSRSCPYASLNACVDDMAKRVGGVPSEFIQSRGTYWCQRVGCK